jgi:hypothetical protein
MIKHLLLALMAGVTIASGIKRPIHNGQTKGSRWNEAAKNTTGNVY